MARPLIWIVLSVMTGVAAGELAHYFPLTVVAALVVAGLVIGVGWILPPAGLTRQKGCVARSFLSAWVIIVATMAFTSGLLSTLHSSPLESYYEQGTLQLTGEVVGFARPYADRTVVLFDLESIGVPQTATAGEQVVRPATVIDGRVRLTVRGRNRSEEPQLLPGDRLRLTAALRHPRGLHNVGLFDAGWYRLRQGIDAVATVRHDRIHWMGREEGPMSHSVLRTVDRWRGQLRQAMAASLKPETAALLSAMLIGESHGVTPERRDQFIAAGVAHLLAISGTHLGMLVAAVMITVRGICHLLPGRWLLWLSRWLTSTQLALLVAMAAATCYALIAGGRVATVRALLMLMIYGGAVWLQRPFDLLTALSAAALVVLAWNPLALGELSFQLSYGAVFGIALVLERWKRETSLRHRRERLEIGEKPRSRWPVWRDRVHGYLLLTVAATVMTTPLVAHHFRQISWVGLVSNLVVPLMAMVIIPLGLLSAVGVLIWKRSTFPLTDLNDWAVEMLLSVVHWFASWPGAVIHPPAPSILLLLALYAGMAALWWRRIRWIRWLAFGSGLLWLVVTTIGLLRPDDRLRVTMLDVGQGDATVVEFPTGESMVIDGGPQYGTYDTGRAVVAPYLWDHHLRRIDYLVATHPQADHIGGQATLMEKFPIGELWHNGAWKSGAIAERWRSVRASHGVSERVVHAMPLPMHIGEVAIDFLNPLPSQINGSASLSSRDHNNRAVVLRLRYGEHQFLLTADIEREAEQVLLRTRPEQLAATVMKVPHHGSRTSSGQEFLAAVNSEYAVISVGARNPYRHPAPNVIEAYQEMGVTLLRTDRDGQVLFVTDGVHLTHLTAAEVRLQPVRWTSEILANEWANYGRVVRRWWWRM